MPIRPYEDPKAGLKVNERTASFLPKEDAIAYRADRSDEEDRLVEELPSWHTSYQTFLYNRATQHAEATGDIISLPEQAALGVLARDGGGASARRYGDTLDPYYRNSDGSINYDRLNSDRFILDLEKAYYQSRGQVPLDFFMRYSDDVQVLGEYPEIASMLAITERIEGAKQAQMAIDNERFSRQANFFSQYRQASFAEAFVLMGRAEDIVAEAGDDIERGQELVNAIVPPWHDEYDGGGLLGGIFNLSGPKQRQLSYGEVKAVVEGTPLRDLDAKYADYTALNQFVADAMGFIPQLLSAGNFVLENDPTVSSVTSLWDSAFGLTQNWQEGRRSQFDNLEAILGQTTYDYTLQAGIGDFSALWNTLPEMDPQEHTILMAMAGGDEAFAEALFIDGLTAAATQDQAIQEAHAQYQSQVETQIRELEEQDFAMSDKVLAMLASYGEAVEFGATLVTKSLVDLATEGAVPNFFDDQFWQEVRDADTPSGVFGLEGTLTGLIMDFGLTTVLDPANIAFAPALGRSMRWGATSAQQVRQYITSPVARRITREAIDFVRSGGGSGRAADVVLDSLRMTGNDELFLAGARGFRDPITGYRSYLDDAGAAASTADVHVSFLDDIADDVAVNRNLVDEAADNIANGTVKPVEVTINPETGQVKITDGAEYGAALRDNGYDAIPTRIKVDPDLGVATVPGIEGYSTNAAKFIDDVAEGRVAQELKDTGRTVKADRSAVPNSISRGQTIIDRFSPEDLGRFTTSEGTEFGLKYFRQGDDTFDYIIVDKDGGVIGNVAVVGDEITMGIIRDNGANKGVMQRVWDEAARNGDDLILLHGRSASTSEAALGFAQKYAKHLQATRGLGTEISWVDDTLGVRDWAKGVPVDDTVRVGSDDFIRPNRLLDDSQIYGDIDLDYIDEIMERHLLDGGDPVQGRRTIVSTMVGHNLGDAVRTNPSRVGEIVDSYMTQINANVRYDFANTTARAQLHQLGSRLWASVRKAQHWEVYSSRLANAYHKQGMYRQQLHRLNQRRAALQTRVDMLHEQLGRRIDDELLDEIADEGVKRGRSEATKLRDSLREELLNLDKEIAQVNSLSVDYTEVANIMDEMLDDFNRNHIATRDEWKDLVNDDGLVPWEQVTGRAPSRAVEDLERVLEIAQREGISIKEAAQKELGYVPANVDALDLRIGADNIKVPELLETLRHKSAWISPASPLEIMVAANAGPNAMKTVLQRMGAQGAQDFAHAAHIYWVMDKVFTNRTGIVVSVDEMVRIFHLGGADSLQRYLRDKAVGVADAVSRVKNSAAWERLPQKWKDRITRLSEYPTHFRMQERSFKEVSGIGQDVITYRKGRNNSEYYNAAQRQAGQWLTDPAMQAYFRGREAFVKWYNESPQAAHLRSMEYITPQGRKVGPPVDEIFNTYDQLVNQWAMSGIRQNSRARALEIWREAAERQATIGTTRGGNVQLPEWVLEGFGSVTGNVAHNARGLGVANMVSDALFQRPVNYRRGFLSDMVKEGEYARLQKLFESQGRRIVPDHEIVTTLQRQYPHLSETVLRAQGEVFDQLAQRHGLISESRVAQMVEAKVIAEVENALYSFQMNSRLGRKAAALAPFGKPYADMIGFWGREMVSRPQLRGWINDSNFMNMGQIANRAVDYMPFNPKAAAFVSRIAATDFDLDRITEDPLVGGAAQAIGLTGADLSPSLFLPTSGNNPFGVLLPGLGIIPVGLLHFAVQFFGPDPVEDPIGYQTWVDQWGEFIPSLGYNQPQDPGRFAANLFFGGGTTSKSVRAADAASTLMFGSPLLADAFNGSWKNRIEANRQMRTEMQSGDFWTELNELPPDLYELGVTAWMDEQLERVTDDAERAAAKDALKEINLEFNVPVRATFSSEFEELDEVWIDSADWMGIEFPGYIRLDTEQGRRQAANEARTAFYALPGWERDALVAENPGLAVNLVSQWRWTEQATVSDRVDTSLPYRSGGSPEQRARHQTYIDKGFIQPMTPKEFMTAVVGVVANAHRSSAIELYEESASVVNEWRWAQFSEEQQQYFQDIADWARAEGELPYETGKELWRNYSDLERVRDKYQADVDPEDRWSIPTKYRAWGESRPSDRAGLRQEFEEGFPVPYISEKMQELSRRLQIDLTATPTMAGVYQMTANHISDSLLDNPQFAHNAAGYYAWLNPKSAGSQATQSFFGNLLDGAQFNDEQRYEYKKVQVWIEETLQRRSEGDDSWLEMRDQAVDKYARMIQDDAFRGVDAVARWNDSWGRSLGALDWEPDEPPPLQDNPNASRVYIREVQDGDTLDVSFGERDFFGTVEVNRVRLLGTNARELGNGGEEEWKSLTAAVEDAIDQGLPIYIVRDPERYGNVDLYGRVLGWLYIGDDPWYNPDTMIPRGD